MSNDCSSGNTKLAKAVIDEVGTEFLRKTFHRSPAAISLWKKNGMPKLVEMFLMNKYPALRAFGGEGELGISK